jgi:hypothetical protein
MNMRTAQPRFSLGKIKVSIGALETLDRYHIELGLLLRRHVEGDWGDLGEEDKEANERAVKQEIRILSAYGKGEARLLVVTEEDRDVTTILRPDEY